MQSIALWNVSQWGSGKYHQTSSIRCTKTKNFAQSTEARRYVENGDVVGAAPTGDASTKFEWSTNKMPIKVSVTLKFDGMYPFIKSKYK